MKKSLKALAVLSLFGLGLGSVTACGGSSKSITISVNGTAVGNGESVNVTETSIFTLNATVDNGSEDDVVVWSTNSPSAITFSSHSGAEITATANTPTTTGWVVAATLESDSTVTTAITVIVDEATRTYSISVDTTSAKTTFFQGETFSTQGLVVNETEYINGTEGDTVELGSSEYTTSIAVGTTLDTLGSQTVTVTSNVDESLTATYVINVVENPLANFFDTKSYSKRYTEGFLDMIISRKGVISPSYHITSCQFTHQDLSTLVLPWRSGFSSEDTFSILNRDGETLGIYRINFTGNESTLSGFEADGWKLKKVTTTARVVVPYHVQAYYLKIGSKKIRIPDTTRKID